jgi:NAD(P)-dependent dehydrogenase (short-subunit alcohol dehydrogenase family)
MNRACAELKTQAPSWDTLILCPGDLAPVGPFDQTDFDEWENSLAINFTAQLRLVRELLHSRRRNSQSLPMVLFFAGGGTNGATVRYSAYTVSKIALIKMCELLDAEIPDVRFTILGPGWVQTKIHEATLSAGQRAGDNLRRTQDRLNKRDFVPMEKVLDCCDWLVGQPREVVGGRNFSVTGDEWGSEVLAKRLMEDPNLYKLRRAGNDSAVVKVR